jgi:glutamate racemase
MKKPIGIFDSGIGGLTVVKQLMRLLPTEQLIYFGDTARIPYGTKSKRLIEQYALEDANFLLQYDIKALVVACNTASSLAMDVLLEHLDIPVVGVVIPGAQTAVELTRNKKIGVIGTIATINSNSYTNEIRKRLNNAQVFAQSCPLLVPLVEEGWLDDDVTIRTLKKYLPDMISEKVDTLILGCTHYPLLENTIQKLMGKYVKLIDSGRETAKAVKQKLLETNLLNESDKMGLDKFLVSDIPMKFEEIGSRFLGKKLENVERVDFERFLMQLGSDTFADISSKVEV